MRIEEKNIHKSAYATKERQYRYRSCTVLNRYGWGVNAKNTLYHVLAKDTRDSLRYLEYALRYLDPSIYCMMLCSKKRT